MSRAPLLAILPDALLYRRDGMKLTRVEPDVARAISRVVDVFGKVELVRESS